MSDTLPERFAARMGHLLGPEFPTGIALAVSGGGDSMAMLALTHEWARVFGVTLWVVTIDHGLRAESADEAAMVAEECAVLGHPHATLRWRWDEKGNLQDAARRARLDLIDQWRGGIAHVLMAHTQDDVAETFLMRLARGSGVEGLSAMAEKRVVRAQGMRVRKLPPEDVTAQHGWPPRPSTRHEAFSVVRPLLQETRADLRHYVNTLKVPYVDDPSNEDPSFDRVKARQVLGEIGIGPDVLADTAHRMARASAALRGHAALVARDIVSGSGSSSLSIDRDRFAKVDRDTQLRLLASALCWTSSTIYRPRASATEALLDRVLAGGGGTLHGAHVEIRNDQIEIYREFAAVSKLVTPTGPSQLWDNRWLIYGPAVDGLAVRALGDAGWQQLPKDLPECVAPDSLIAKTRPRHAIARTLPAVFDGDRLVGFRPFLFGALYVAEFRPPAGQFITYLESR